MSTRRRHKESSSKQSISNKCDQQQQNNFNSSRTTTPFNTTSKHSRSNMQSPHKVGIPLAMLVLMGALYLSTVNVFAATAAAAATKQLEQLEQQATGKSVSQSVSVELAPKKVRPLELERQVHTTQHWYQWKWAMTKWPTAAAVAIECAWRARDLPFCPVAIVELLLLLLLWMNKWNRKSFVTTHTNARHTKTDIAKFPCFSSLCSCSFANFSPLECHFNTRALVVLCFVHLLSVCARGRVKARDTKINSQDATLTYLRAHTNI